MYRCSLECLKPECLRTELEKALKRRVHVQSELPIELWLGKPIPWRLLNEWTECELRDKPKRKRMLGSKSIDLVTAHDKCSKNREILLKEPHLSHPEGAVCFFCFKRFPGKSVKEWVSKGDAICPFCHTDTVLPNLGEKDKTVYDDAFLKAMYKFWFQSHVSTAKSKTVYKHERWDEI